MSETSQAARKAMKEKAHRLANGDPHQKVDASGWTEAEPLNAGVKTGLRPLSRRQFKTGGKVEGEHAAKRADRRRRKAGGQVEATSIADAHGNLNLKDANEKREGTKHIGGMKRGGRAHGGEAGGGGSPDWKRGGRAHKADGGPDAGVPPTRFQFQSGPSQASRAMGLKHGGHVDERDDEELIRREVKSSALKRRASGGEVGDPREVIGHYEENGQHWLHTTPRSVSANSDPSVIRAEGRPTYGPYSSKRAAMSDAKKQFGDVLVRPSINRQARKSGGATEDHSDGHWMEKLHKGGLHRALHVPEGQDIPHKAMAKAEHSKNPHVKKMAVAAETMARLRPGKACGGSLDGEIEGTRPTGGREARRSGGRAKGKTNINIVIAPGGRESPAPTPPMGAGAPGIPPRPPGAPVPVPVTSAPPQGMPMPMPAGGLGAGGMGAGMPRRRGGRTNYEAGAGTGEGRLEKIEHYGEPQRR